MSQIKQLTQSAFVAHWKKHLNINFYSQISSEKNMKKQFKQNKKIMCIQEFVIKCDFAKKQFNH